jgi:hypothetical protein
MEDLQYLILKIMVEWWALYGGRLFGRSGWASGKAEHHSREFQFGGS